MENSEDSAKSRETTKVSVIYAKETIEQIKQAVEFKFWPRYRGNVSQYIVEATLDRLERDGIK